jgi:predicted phosphodiesterase
MPVAYTVDGKQGNVVTVRMKTGHGWSQKILLLADIHFDSEHCDRKLLKELLDDAVSCGAGIIIIGDLLDIMGGRNDRRGSKGALRSEYKNDDYVNRVIDDVVEFLEPYAANIIFISTGNHETAILKFIEYDLLATICRRLGVIKMGYAGFLRFLFAQECGTGGRTSRTLYFHHGAAGGEVTQGISKAQRDAAKVLADVYVSGHNHTTWYTEMKRTRLNGSGREQKETEIHISIPTMKDEHDLAAGYHIEKDRSPRPLGGFWLEWKWKKRSPQNIGCTAYKAD